MCISGGDECSHWEEFTVVAKEACKCTECHAPILAGDKHLLIELVADGLCDSCDSAGEHVGGEECACEVEQYHMHLECRALWDFMIKDVCGGKGMLMLGGLLDEIDDHREYWSEPEGERDTPVFCVGDVFNSIKEAYACRAAEVSP